MGEQGVLKKTMERKCVLCKGWKGGQATWGNIRRYKAHLELALVKDREVKMCFCRYLREKKTRENMARGAGLAFCDENLGELEESSGA